MKVAANGIELDVDEQGEGEPLVMIMGLGAQRILWPQPLRDMLHARGFRTVCFDNRDIGASSWMRDAPVPDVKKLLLGAVAGFRGKVPYALTDMACDVAGLLDARGLSSAHVVGASMGGMIAQCFAIQFPHRVKSLTSIMSTTGDRWSAMRVKPNALRALVGSKVPSTRDEAGERLVAMFQSISGPGYPVDPAMMYALGALAFDRGSNPAGFVRQLAAVLTQLPRTQALAKLNVPSLVIHGTDDPLVHVSAGRITAEAIPGAWMMEFKGMGHSLPPPLWSVMADAIAGNARRN